MKPTIIQKTLAGVWITNLKIALIIVIPIVSAIYFVKEYNDRGILIILGLIFLGVVGGFVLSILLMNLLNWIQQAINGGAFQVGDRVGILSGEREGLYGVVEELLKEKGRLLVSVELENGRMVKEEFWRLQLYKVREVCNSD